MKTKIVAVFAVILALAWVNPAGAWASTTTLPPLTRKVECTDRGVDTYGTAWAYFIRDDATGRRSAYRGGFTADYEWSITQVQTVGVAGDHAYTKGTVTFDSGQHAASEYTPTAWASRPNVSLEVAFTIYKDGVQGKCAILFDSN